MPYERMIQLNGNAVHENFQCFGVESARTQYASAIVRQNFCALSSLRQKWKRKNAFKMHRIIAVGVENSSDARGATLLRTQVVDSKRRQGKRDEY